MTELDEIKKKAVFAKNKKAPLGTDLDLDNYSTNASPHSYFDDLTVFSKEEQQTLRMSGVEPDAHNRAGTFVMMDNSVVHNTVSQDGVEVLSTDDALEKHSWLKDYWWKAVAVDTDKYTAHTELEGKHLGYFIRVLPGTKTIRPLQSCLYMSQDNISQNVHNIIIVEEGAQLDIITGCAVSRRRVQRGAHIGVSEFYVKRNAKLSFTMIHNWAPDIAVRPRTGVIVEENGTFLNNYASLQPVRSLQAYPTTKLIGRNAIARYHNILLAPPRSELDTGARVYLLGQDSRTEIISRAITTGGNICARGHIIGIASGVKGHLECEGLILKEGGFIRAVPELEGMNPDVELSHEAAVGKIAKEVIMYLQARGLTEKEATATIVSGFLDVKIEGLPAQLQTELDKVIAASKDSMF
ncbi:MAG: SufD family Fe-S cluster assembly protein [Promethearchaeota archaeon]